MTATRRVVCLLLALLGACLPLAGLSADDRGIGGTGGPAAGPEISSDRGIGGTGIVGVVTGFGSVFVDGLEVAYTPATPLTVDGEADAQAALLVGETVAIVASDDHGLQAVSIAVRHEVSGPVSWVGTGGPNGRMAIVAGQRVWIATGTDGLRTVRPGNWIMVSGLRQPSGVIAASRIDPRMPGTVLVRGPAMLAAGGWRIGNLWVRPPDGTNLAPGESITARGTIANGSLSVTTASPDVLGSDPAAFFGSHVRRMVIEGYVSAARGQVRLGRGSFATAAPGIAASAGAHRAIVELERGANGGFVATHLRGAGRPVTPGRHGSLGPRRAAPHAVRPTYYRPHPWQDRRPGIGRGGDMPGRRGCVADGGCRRDEGPR